MQHLRTLPELPVFDVAVRASGTTRTVAVSGEVDLLVAGRLAAAIDEAFAAGPETVVIDLGGVGFMDSSGIHVIVRAQRRAEDAAVRLVVIPGSVAVRRAFAVSGLQHVVPFAPRASAPAERDGA
jgi:anti-sigma B factor antagonist